MPLTPFRLAATSSAWQVVATNVTNRVSPQQSAFAVDPAKRIVNISIIVNADSRNGNAVRVDTTVEGRNTVYGYPSNLCGRDDVAAALANGEIPPYPTPDPAES